MKVRLLAAIFVVSIAGQLWAQGSRVGRNIRRPGNSGVRIGRSAASYNFNRYSYGRGGTTGPTAATGPLYRDLSSGASGGYDLRRRGGSGYTAPGAPGLVPSTTTRYGPRRSVGVSVRTAPGMPRPGTDRGGRADSAPLIPMARQPSSRQAGESQSVLVMRQEPITTLVPDAQAPHYDEMAEAEKTFREGDYYSAERKYGRAIRRREDLPDPYIGAMLSSLHAYRSSYSLAANYLAKAISLRPELIDAPLDLAALHGKGEADRFDRAVEAIDQTILRRGAQGQALLVRAYFKYRRGDKAGARRDLLQAKTLRESRLAGDASDDEERSDVLLEGIEAFLEQMPQPES